MLANIFTTILTVSVTTGIVIFALVLLSPHLNRSFAAKWKYWVWLLLAVRLLIPFHFTFPEAPVQVLVPDTTISPLLSPLAPPVVPDFAPADPNPPVQSAAHSMNLWGLVSIIWLGGGILFLAYQLVSYRRCRREVLRWSLVAEDKRLHTALYQLCVEMGIRQKITLRISQKVSGPMTMGLFKSYLLLPHEDYADNELVHILRHELVHLKRRDIRYKLLMLLANALHWFNPVVHLMVREVNKDLELACDDETIKNLPFEKRKEYSDTIINSIRRQHSRHTALSTYFYGGEKAMKERFANILSHKKKRAGKMAGVAVMLCVLLIGGMVACDTLNTPQVDLTDYELLYEQYLRLPFLSSITAEKWDDAKDIPPDCFVYYYAYYWHENDYQGGPLRFSPADLESYIQKYFDVSAEYIRTADQYDSEDDVYICGGFGGGGSAKVVGAEQNGKRLVLDYEVYSPEDDVTVLRSGKLTVELSGNGYKYIANEMQYTEAFQAAVDNFDEAEMYDWLYVPSMDDEQQEYYAEYLQQLIYNGMLMLSWSGEEYTSLPTASSGASESNNLIMAFEDIVGEQRMQALWKAYGEYLPAEEVEAVLLERFPFTQEQLHEIVYTGYNGETNTYHYGGGRGGGPIEGAVVGIEKRGEFISLSYEIYTGYSGLDEEPSAYLYKLPGTLVIRENGNQYRYWSVAIGEEVQAEEKGGAALRSE